MLKEITIGLLQRLLGFETYLFRFAQFKIRTLRGDAREKDFFVFLRTLPDDGVVLDVGANIGVMAFHLSRHVRRGEVVAFEPVPHNVAVLHRVIERYGLGNVRVEACALGDREGTVEMVMPVEHGARRHGLSHVVHAGVPDRNRGPRFSVPMRRLDDFAFGPRVTAIKIDVENFESFVLAGGEATLRKHRPVLYVELWPNENRTRCLALLESLGYHAFVCEGDRETPYAPERHRQQNFVFRCGGS